jgi:hypothetical protein
VWIGKETPQPFLAANRAGKVKFMENRIFLFLMKDGNIIKSDFVYLHRHSRFQLLKESAGIQPLQAEKLYPLFKEPSVPLWIKDYLKNYYIKEQRLFI